MAAPEAPADPSPQVKAAIDGVEAELESAPATEPGASAHPPEPLAAAPGDEVGDTDAALGAESSPAAEDSDPLAPILPSGPEPGSPEADAELTELLEESTLTQDEFDKAFRGGGPTIDGDQFVFGPNERTRKQPLAEQGEPKSSSSP